MDRLRDRSWRQPNLDDSRSWADPFLCRLDEAWVLYYPVTDKLLILNATAKTVWDLVGQGYEAHEIARVFAQSFGVSEPQATRDVANVLTDLTDTRPQEDEHVSLDAWAVDQITTASVDRAKLADCGVYRFGARRIRVRSAVAELDESFFLRFQHRVTVDCQGADELNISRDGLVFRLTFGGRVVAEAKTIGQAVTHLVELLMSVEHSHQSVLAYCHAGAVSRGGRNLLMPGGSGVGKSTLTGFLAAHGFAYLGDDTIAIGEDDMSLLPLPTSLSIKAGSWTLLEPRFPTLRTLATLERYGRSIRYVAPDGNYESLQTAPAPNAIVFPAYSPGKATPQLTPVRPIQTMVHLLGAHARLSRPATEIKLAKFVRFVEQTPAYELSYSELPDAMKAIEELLGSQG